MVVDQGERKRVRERTRKRSGCLRIYAVWKWCGTCLGVSQPKTLDGGKLVRCRQWWKKKSLWKKERASRLAGYLYYLKMARARGTEAERSYITTIRWPSDAGIEPVNDWGAQTRRFCRAGIPSQVFGQRKLLSGHAPS